jgi:hypothetical protein
MSRKASTPWVCSRSTPVPLGGSRTTRGWLVDIDSGLVPEILPRQRNPPSPRPRLWSAHRSQHTLVAAERDDLRIGYVDSDPIVVA